MVSDGTTAQTWICPVARDAVDTDNGVESAQIIVVGPVASCLFMRSAIQTNIANRARGFYHFRCSIPAGSGVVMYRLDENNDDEN